MRLLVAAAAAAAAAAATVPARDALLGGARQQQLDARLVRLRRKGALLEALRRSTSCRTLSVRSSTALVVTR